MHVCYIIHIYKKYVYKILYRKEQRKTEGKAVNEHPISTEPSINTNVEVAVSAITTSAISTTETTVSGEASLVTPSITTTTSSITNTDRDYVAMEAKPQLTPITMMKKTSTIGGKPVAIVKTNATQSLLQSNQHNFPHHQIQVSTSAGLQTIRLAGHSVLQSAQQPISANSSPNVTNGTTNLTTILPCTKMQSQQQQPTVVTNQAGKSILQSTNMKQQQQQQSQQQQSHVLPGKTLLASQIKLVSSSQIKSLLTGHSLQGQTIFIKQSSSSNNQSQQQLQQQQQQQLKVSQ